MEDKKTFSGWVKFLCEPKVVDAHLCFSNHNGDKGLIVVRPYPSMACNQCAGILLSLDFKIENQVMENFNSKKLSWQNSPAC